MKITIAKDFSDTPGGRTIAEGENSGELFREELLCPAYIQAKKNNEILQIDFDGTFGYPPSFLDESFGGLVRKIKEKNILDNIQIISMDDLTIERRIRKYVSEAEAEVFGGK